MILLIPSLLSQAFAADRLEVEIRSTILNIREIMSTKSPVVGVLNQGNRLFVTTTDHQDWIRLDDGRGFISIHYVNVLSRTPVEEIPDTPSISNEAIAPIKAEAANAETGQVTVPPIDTAECSTDTEQPTLTVTSVSKTCRKNLTSLSYESCDIVYNIETSANCSNIQETGFECSAKVLATKQDGTEYLDDLIMQGKKLSIGASKQVRLSWFPSSPDMQITRIVLQEDNCLITP